MKGRAILVLATAAMLSPPAAFASTRTTSPSTRVTIVVRINDKGINPLAQFSVLGQGDSLKIMPQGSRVPRGDYATFTVFNEGKKPHDFTILGRTTGTIKPGRRSNFNILLKTRGTFRYSSTLDRGKTFHGFLSVV
jgi:plastocyanin